MTNTLRGTSAAELIVRCRSAVEADSSSFEQARLFRALVPVAEELLAELSEAQTELVYLGRREVTRA